MFIAITHHHSNSGAHKWSSSFIASFGSSIFIIGFCQVRRSRSFGASDSSSSRRLCFYFALSASSYIIKFHFNTGVISPIIPSSDSVTFGRLIEEDRERRATRAPKMDK